MCGLVGVACMLTPVFGLNSGTGGVARRLRRRNGGKEGGMEIGERREKEKE